MAPFSVTLCYPANPRLAIPAPAGILLAMLPFRRSLTLWSGVLVMAFLCCAWRDSFQRGYYIGWGSWEASNSAGLAGIAYNGAKAPAKNLQFGYEKSPKAFGHGLFPPYRTLVRGNGATALKFVAVPHWQILIAAGVSWSALLLWRARRGKYRTLVEANP